MLCASACGNARFLENSMTTRSFDVLMKFSMKHDENLSVFLKFVASVSNVFASSPFFKCQLYLVHRVQMTLHCLNNELSKGE